jgi:hypothetical protein
MCCMWEEPNHSEYGLFIFKFWHLFIYCTYTDGYPDTFQHDLETFPEIYLLQVVSLIKNLSFEFNCRMKLMLRSVPLLLLTLVADVSGQESCFLCAGNEAPANPDLFFFLLNATCGELTDIALTQTFDEESCFLLNEYGPFVCGCPGAKAGSCSGLCPDGSPPPTPDAEAPDFLFDGVTCADVDLFAKATSNDTECSDIRQSFSSMCGCSGSSAPSSCSGVCANGMPVPNPDVTFGGETCGNLDFLVKLTANVTECSEYQQVYGPACGCADMCTVCPGGNVVPKDSLSLPLTLVDGTTTTCGDFETSIMNLSSTECPLDKFPIADQCGCPAQNCTLCPNGAQPDFFTLLGIDESLIFVCALTSAFINGTQPDCEDLTESGLPYICGCPNAALPSTAVGCTLCTDGTLSDPALVHPNGGTCGSFNHFVAISNQMDCDLAQISGEAWFCGCDGVEPPDDIDAFLNPSGNVTSFNDDLFGGNDTFFDDNFNDDLFGGNYTMEESKGKKKMKKGKKEEHKMGKKFKKKGTRRLVRSGEIPEVIARQGGRVRGG